MRHRWHGRKLGRTSKHRDAMTRNMVTSLIDEERVRTTLAKAKEFVATPSASLPRGRRARFMRVARSLLSQDPRRGRQVDGYHRPEIAERPGGYTRILRLPPRQGDAAPMALLELIDRDTTREQERRERRQKRKEAQGKHRGSNMRNSRKEGRRGSFFVCLNRIGGRALSDSRGRPDADGCFVCGPEIRLA